MITSRRIGGIAAAFVFGMVFIAGDRAAAARLSNGAVFSQNFDNVTVPALPNGWVATNAAGPDPLWVTAPTYDDVGMPNAAYVDDPHEVSDKRLDSPPFFIYTNGAQLSFFHVRSLNAHIESPATTHYWDGGVLEISVNGGTFQDIIEAGGSFPTSGYDGIIEGEGNPLAGRSGWSDRRLTPDVVIVNLPPVGGSTVVLRWRLGSSSTPHEYSCDGWWIDSVEVCDGYPCTAIPIPARFDLDTVGNGVWEPGEVVDAGPITTTTATERSSTSAVRP